VPKLWNETIDAHRRAVRDATLDATAALVSEFGLASVTMSQIAAETGIGRATLYKYFPDVDTIMIAWHDRQVARHLDPLAQVRDQHSDPGRRLEAVLGAFGLIHHEHHGGELAAQLHQGAHMAQARRHLHGFIHDLLVEGVHAGQIRTDVAPGELASYCLSAMEAASDLSGKAAVRRLVKVILAGLRPLR
jgi:AcrR family transcriptional regulator